MIFFASLIDSHAYSVCFCLCLEVEKFDMAMSGSERTYDPQPLQFRSVILQIE